MDSIFLYNHWDFASQNISQKIIYLIKILSSGGTLQFRQNLEQLTFSNG